MHIFYHTGEPVYVGDIVSIALPSGARGNAMIGGFSLEKTHGSDCFEQAEITLCQMPETFTQGFRTSFRIRRKCRFGAMQISRERGGN